MSYNHRLDYTRAYVLIDTESGRTDLVVQGLRRIKDIRLADAINGPHGVIAVVEGNNASVVAAVILVHIKKLQGVKNMIVYAAIPQKGEKTPAHS